MNSHSPRAALAKSQPFTHPAWRVIALPLRTLLLATLALLACAVSIQAVSAQTTITITADRDADLYEGNKGEDNFGGCDFLYVGGEGGKAKDRDRGIIGFSLATIPAGATITSATLRLTNINRAEFEPDNRNVSVHRVLNSWTEGNGACFDDGTSGQNVSWDERSTNVAWSNPGGDFTAAAIATTTVGDVGVYNWAVTSQVQAWFNNSHANHGFIVKYSPEDVGTRFKNFASSEFATIGSRPQLIVTYQPLCNATLGGATSTCPGTTANVTPASGGTWGSSDNTIASVANNGVVTGNNPGTVTLTYTETATGCVYTKQFTVTARPTVGGATAVCQGFTANVTPSTGGTWGSSNTSVATVTNAGVVTGVSPGIVTLTFTSTATGCTNTRSFTVNALPTLGGASAVCQGLTANVTPATGGTWSSSNNAVATVTNVGVVTGVSPGIVTLTFTNSTTGCTNTRSFTVNSPPILGGPTALCQGSTINVTPSTGGTWSSNNIGRATVTNAGVVTGISPGPFTLTFTSTATGCSNTRSLTVLASPTLGGATKGCVGSPASVTPSTGGTWSSSNPAVATVTNAGVVTGVAPGPVTLTFTNSSTGCSNTRSFTVNAVPVLGGASSACANSTANVTPSTGGTWSSSNTNIASVSNAGLVTGIRGGTVTLTFTSTSTGCSASMSFTVSPAPVLEGAASVNVGATSVITPSTGGTWSSSDTGIATITNEGLVTGVSLGQATLTFTNTATGCSGFKVITITPIETYLNSSMIDGLDQDDPTLEDHIETEPVFPRATNLLIVSVFEDTTGDGLANLPLAGIVITLSDEEGNVVATVNTAVNGLYSFENLEPGFYTVTQTVPGGTFTLYENPIPVSISLGDIVHADFVNSSNGSISGTITANNGDEPQVGVLVSLLDENGDPVLDGNNLPITTVTDLNGFYQFANIPPATYQVQQIVPTGFTAVTDVDGGNLTVNGDVTPLVVLPGTDIVGMDFVNFEPGKITGNVSIDTTLDLGGDTPHDGVTVGLLDASGNPVLDGSSNPITTVTDVNGNYAFGNLPPGDYWVAQVLPAGFTAVSDSDGGDFTVVGDLTLITVTEGEVGVANFTNQRQTDIAVTKVVDNSTPVVGTNVTFTVVVTNNGPNDAAAVVVDDIASGLIYVNDSATQGTFTLNPGAPTNTFQGLWEVGGLAIGESATLTVTATVSTETSIAVYRNSVVASSELGDPDLTNNDDEVEIDPGLGSISGTVRDDTTGDGNGDTPQSGVTVALLDENATPILDGSNNPVTTTTDSNGNYSFSDLPPGDYQVVQLPPAGFIAIDDVDGGDLTINGDLTPITLTAGQATISQDFVNTALASIAGNVSLDNTGDNNGNLAIEGVVVVLRDSAGDIVLNGIGDPITTITDASGNYAFSGVPVGQYQVSIVPPGGLLAVNDVDGGDLTVIGDITLIDLLPGQSLTAQDFALSDLADLGVVKVVDNSAPPIDSIVNFTVTVVNNGPVAATNVIANDLLPSGYTFTGSSATQGSYDEFTGIWEVGSLANGGDAVLTVTATVLSTGSYNNIVTVTGDQTDLDLDNNTDNEEPVPVPKLPSDITPVVTAQPNVMNGPTDFNVRIQVVELLNVDTDGLITVRIPKDTRWVLREAYSPALTLLDGVPMNNNLWTYSENATQHIFTSNPLVVIAGGKFSYFGIKARWVSVNQQGVYTITGQIDSGSGNENRIDNNSDAERIDFFNN